MKALLSDFWLGIRTWMQSWNFIFSNGLAHYFIYPFVISLLTGMGALVLIDHLTDTVMALIAPHVQFGLTEGIGWWEQSKDFLAQLSSAGLKMMLWIVGIYLYWKFGKYLTLAAMSPVMALLSERTDKILSGKDYPFDALQFVKDIFRGIFMALRNALLELCAILALWMAGCLLLWFVSPVGTMLAPLIMLASFLISAYFFGFSAMDYTAERRRMGIGASARYIRKAKGIAVGNGMIFSLLFLIPWIGTSLATVTCTVAAGLAMHRKEMSGK
jgi:CysZ protein